jgi:hypothetical protein
MKRDRTATFNLFRQAALAAFALFVLSPATAASDPDTVATRSFDWLTGNKTSGSLVTQIRQDGTRITDFQFNDRGRGPKIRESARTNYSGKLVALEISGHSYMGAAVDEKYRVADGLSRWQSTLEQGESTSAGFYFANDGSPQQLALLARNLLGAPGAGIDLLPAGRASIAKVAEYRLQGESAGRALSLYAISGLDLAPRYLWLDDENELYALTLGWMGMAPRGEGGILPVLQALQDEAEDSYHERLSRQLSQVLPAHWILRNVSIVDVEQGALLPGRMVFVRNGRIVRIEADRDLGLPVYGDLEPRIIDGQGQVLIPGLWDMHTHVSPEDGLLHIAAGVTTIRDLGNDPARLLDVTAAFDRGHAIGPRTVAAGFIDRKSPFSAPAGRLAESLEDALNMVNEYAAAGYPQIKIYSSIEPGWVRPLAEAVHGRNMRLSGHVPSFMSAEQAVLNGFDEIQHINMLFLNFLAGPQDDTRTPLRFSLVAEGAASLDLSAPEVGEFISLLRREEIVIDPTVAIFDSMFRHRSGELDPSYAMVADHMPPAVRRGMLAGDIEIDEQNADRYGRSADALLQMIGALHQAGIRLVAGTDALPGFTLHRELELYRQAGINHADVLKTATIGAASVAGQSADSGSIAVGKRADFVLLAGNPLEDISAVRRPVAVFRGDRWFDPARLYETIGIRPFTR